MVISGISLISPAISLIDPVEEEPHNHTVKKIAPKFELNMLPEDILYYVLSFVD